MSKVEIPEDIHSTVESICAGCEENGKEHYDGKPQREEVFILGVDVNCTCESGPEKYTICGNCMVNKQIAKRAGCYYIDGKFVKKNAR